MNPQTAIDDSDHAPVNSLRAIEAIESAVSAERKRCAMIASTFHEKWRNANGFEGHTAAARIIAATIRDQQ